MSVSTGDGAGQSAGPRTCQSQNADNESSIGKHREQADLGGFPPGLGGDAGPCR